MKGASLIILSILLVTLSGCELIGDIFELGVWAGVLLVVGVVALIIFLFSRLFGSK